LELEVVWQVIENQIENNLENGEEYMRLIQTPYQIMILEK
jgi:hypothetical protein